MTEDYFKPKYPIREAAKILGISVHTLRMYEREGLILPYQKDTGHRLYSDSDIDRLQCIRTAIREKKISIAGIKSLFSMIPCWQIIHCTEEDRKNCKAYAESKQPCWAYNHINNLCATIECVDCEVYISFQDCSTVKDAIKNIPQS
ncbi:MAG: MerR family transcriptional regulator [Ignavibacteriaceae bacterium]|nr:MerR family transcriptional regulator [Ignavibacteriaceae bacterium]